VFSAYRDSSELSLVNREAAERPVAVSEEFFDLTDYAVEAWKQTRGAFDITVGPLIALWGLRNEESTMPSETALQEARDQVGSGKLTLRANDRTIRLNRHGMSLDFGGLAKGYAAERVARITRQHGALATLVNLGDSSLAASDGDIPNGAWEVGINDPADTQRCSSYLSLNSGECLSTSGTYRKRVKIDGTLQSHLLDPRTGRPLEGIRSATAIARSGRQSEVLSKYLLTAAKV
jgi:thiamine biosynthesis lipoprotein